MSRLSAISAPPRSLRETLCVLCFLRALANQNPSRAPNWSCRGMPPPKSDPTLRKLADRMSPVGLLKFGSLVTLKISANRSSVRTVPSRAR